MADLLLTTLDGTQLTALDGTNLKALQAAPDPAGDDNTIVDDAFLLMQTTPNPNP